jgi:hypothetical protein
MKKATFFSQITKIQIYSKYLSPDQSKILMLFYVFVQNNANACKEKIHETNFNFQIFIQCLLLSTLTGK